VEEETKEVDQETETCKEEKEDVLFVDERDIKQEIVKKKEKNL